MFQMKSIELKGNWPENQEGCGRNHGLNRVEAWYRGREARGLRFGSNWRNRLQGSQECDKVCLLLNSELQGQDEVEELNGVVDRQETAVVQVGWGIL